MKKRQKTFLEEIEERFKVLNENNVTEDNIDEINVTGNMDGGEGPPKTPNAFASGKKHWTHHKNRMEVLGYRLVDKKKKKINTAKSKSVSPLGESTFKQMMKELYSIDEASKADNIEIGDTVSYSDGYNKYKGVVTGKHHLHNNEFYVKGFGDPLRLDQLTLVKRGKKK